MSKQSGPLSAENRSRILADHEALRRLLAAVEKLAQRLLEGDGGALAPLRQHGLGLTARLGDHLALEESLLMPVLTGVGLEGERQADRIRREHEEQRLLLDYIVSRLEDQSRPTSVLGRELAAFAEVLLDDMEHEEQGVLALLEAAPGVRDVRLRSTPPGSSPA